MRLLLDTHIFLWSVQDSPRLTKRIRKIMEEAEAVYVSAASIWEITIKAKLGKLKVFPPTLAGTIYESGFQELPITAQHAAQLWLLPDLHKDPFDRLLIAQAKAEPLHLLTVDTKLPPYSELVILV